MRQISFVMHGKTNSIFEEQCGPDSESPNHKYTALRDCFRKAGYEICTDDRLPPEKADIVIHKDYVSGRLIDKENTYLIALESPLICPGNFDEKNHKKYRAIFTWHDDLVGRNNVIKFNYSFNMNLIKGDIGRRSKLVTMIAENKSSSGRGELYSARRQVIKWYEKNVPDAFDLYGRGWDKIRLKGRIGRLINRFNLPATTCPGTVLSTPKNYRGPVQSKIDSLKNYNFSYCFENVYGVPGYVTEKVIHCLQAGCVPIYYGAPNIERYIPRDCLIRFEDFPNITELNSYLLNMSDSELFDYQSNIIRFLTSPDAEVFSSEHNAEIIVRNIIGHQNGH